MYEGRKNRHFNSQRLNWPFLCLVTLFSPSVDRGVLTHPAEDNVCGSCFTLALLIHKLLSSETLTVPFKDLVESISNML